MVIENGIITELNNQSGHYWPLPETLKFILNELEKRAVDISKIKVNHAK
ncbi:MAG: hypothetical protein M3R17_18025 [Bacteroidota bacterium]|nr:hypothetical protein [Bacteroidota bacterium]